MGVVLSLLQIYQDYVRQTEEISESVAHNVKIISSAAKEAAFQLNLRSAKGVAEGLLKDPSIIQVRLSTEFGGDLVNLKREVGERSSRWIIDLLFADEVSQEFKLYSDDADKMWLGTLFVVSDPYEAVGGFIQRAKLIVVSGLVRNFLLAFVIMGVFYLTITKTLTRFSDNLALIDPQNPGNTKIIIPDQHKDDEFGVLVRMTNDLMNSVEENLRERKNAETALNAANESLEIKVQERTARLEVQIAEREKAEQKAKAALEQLERQQFEMMQLKKMESLGSLTAGIAHNLNNFLQPIAMCGSLMLKKLPDESDELEMAKIIIRANQRARDLVKHLMAYSRQEVGEKSVQSIHSVIDDTLSLMIQSVPSTATIHQDLDKDTGDLLMNRGQIQTVVMNLISNAIDALHGKTGDVTVMLSRIKANEDSGYGMHSSICFSVADTGVGMNDETKDKMYDPFFTMKQVGEGTGLGLSSVFGIVADHGGTINCSSTPGRGTTFKILLPLVVDETNDQPSAHSKIQ